jgi:hypothetical protein
LDARDAFKFKCYNRRPTAHRAKVIYSSQNIKLSTTIKIKQKAKRNMMFASGGGKE